MKQLLNSKLDTKEKRRHALSRIALVIGGNLLFAIGINVIISPMK